MTTAIDHLTTLVRYPVGAAARAVGLAKGVAGAVVRLAVPEPGHRGEVPVQRDAPTSDGPSLAPAAEPPAAAAPQREPGDPGESFVTEPSAVTRTSAHGGRGEDAELDDWYGETDVDEEPLSIVEVLESNDPPEGPVDQAAIRATLAESEVLRRAADSGERDRRGEQR